jgi:hypothetical protein
LQKNTEFPVAEYYGAQTATTKKIKTIYEKREERKLQEVHNERGRWREKKDTQGKLLAKS